jgi:hypothetical protein
MLTRIRRRLPGGGNGPWIVLAAAAAAMIITPFAVAAGEGRPIDGGARNPSSNQSLSYNRETEIIANTATYGTRQSNKSTNGGGAVYGCRSGPGGTPRNNEPCLRGNNLSTGLAFEFAFEGATGGTIDSRVSGDTRRPFTTNATGVATGLNADRVDSKSASEITSDAAAAANRFAVVNAAGALGSNRGATSAANPAGAGTYSVVFSGNISTCALAATVSETAGGAASVALGADNQTVSVVTRDPGGAAADHPFHLTVTC